MEQRLNNSSLAVLKADVISAIPTLRAFARALCWNVDRADDLVQETLTRALENLDSFDRGTNLKAWLRTILRNTYYSEQRKRRRELPDPDGIAAAQLISAPDQDGRLDFQDFLAALQLLPSQQREAVILIGAEGMTYDEAAQICGCSIGTIKSRLSRGRERLSSLLGETGTEPVSGVEPLRCSATDRSRGRMRPTALEAISPRISRPAVEKERACA